MKKRLLLKFILGVALFSIVLISCEKNSEAECTTCSSSDFKLTNVNLLDTNIELKQYDNETNDFHFL